VRGLTHYLRVQKEAFAKTLNARVAEFKDVGGFTMRRNNTTNQKTFCVVFVRSDYTVR